MTTAPDHHEPLDDGPLSPEERDLAARLGRIGPVDGPSPALDAKILAAAHAAASAHAPRKHRRLAWFGVPPALVTGVGVAAAAVLALGLVWQVRPQYTGVAAQSEADAGEEIILIAPSSDAAAPSQTDAAASAERPEPAAPAPTVTPQATRPAARSGPAAPADAEVLRSASAPAPPPPPAAPPDESVAAAAAPAASVAAAPAAAAGTIASEDSFVPTPSDTQHRNATYTTAARAMAERRERSAAQAQRASAADEGERVTLDRIEVTGTRIANVDANADWSQVPVGDDTHLPSAEWLERIRARRDGGDTDNARASLKLFQREYPRIRLPDDVRALLVDTKR